MTNFDETFSIDTPENVFFEYNVAGIGSRFLAALVDTLLIAVLEVILAFVLVLPLISIIGDIEGRLSSWVLAVFALIAFVIFWGYYIFFEMIWNGQSPGKRWVGLRVIRSDGMPVTLTESIIRNLVRIIDFLPANYGVGVIAMFIGSQSRRLGDLAAGTIVVYDRRMKGLPDLKRPGEDARAEEGEGRSGGWPVGRLTKGDIHLLETYFQRRDGLKNRNELAKDILQVLLERMELPPEGLHHAEAEAQLREIARALRPKVEDPR
jgi:uncharacterized RDD family membrane protein YckC